MSGIGHNNGPSMERGFGWRKTAWEKARAELIPNLPIEILRRRVNRAKELGLPYRTYASVRASTGRDVIGFLFSNNALRVMTAQQTIPFERANKVKQVRGVSLCAAVHAPMPPQELEACALQACLSFDALVDAPHISETWSEIRRKISAPLEAERLPKDGVLVIGDTSHEAIWSEAAKLAGFLPSDVYFEMATQGL